MCYLQIRVMHHHGMRLRHQVHGPAAKPVLGLPRCPSLSLSDWRRWYGPRGASEIARRGVSTPVFVGMLAASTVGIFLIPMLYVVFQTLREKAHRKPMATSRLIRNRPSDRRHFTLEFGLYRLMNR